MKWIKSVFTYMNKIWDHPKIVWSIFWTVTAAAFILLFLSGCSSKDMEPFQDAPKERVQDTTPARIINMPDGFSNISRKCDGPNMIYVLYHGDAAYGAIAVAPNDPRCVK